MNKVLKKLRTQMKKEGVDIYLLPNSDAHMSEYVGEHDRYVMFLSGFSGSNATVVVTADKAGLWTDGRYFIQAEKQLKGSDISLYRMNVEGEPTVREFIKKESKKGSVLGFDGRLVTKEEFDFYTEDAAAYKGSIKTDFYAMDGLWESRPKKSKKKLWILDEKYAGLSMAKKLKAIRKVMKEKGADATLISDLCDIAWVLNLRGDDISTVPVFYSYLYIGKEEVLLFVQKRAVSYEVQKALYKQTDGRIQLHELDRAYTILKKIEKKKILIDETSVNIALVKSFTDCTFIHAKSPVLHMRSVKNPTEIRNMKISHVLDGVALTKYIYSIKKTYRRKNGSETSELKASKELLKLRSRMDGFIGESFSTIAAYGPNAAMMHYTPGPGNDAHVNKKGFLLIDSGGHYLTGTTDVTRTIAMGRLSREEKESYTTVLKAHLALMDAHFQKGACGETLDVIAREYFWRDGKDYLCGTGHGVGYLLSVHEGVHSLRWRILKDPTPLEPGMVVTDEPGYYEAGKYGVRIENELLVVKDKTTEYGTFYKFAPLTFVPYEMDAVITQALSSDDKRRLNEYNALCYRTLKPHLTKEEAAWLKEVTKPVE